ncbi:hypothetical protein KBZ10_13790 [Streptomyces sp. F63]|uniref:AAA domain-containing protein n=1 Tax=Streptomyces sp. F63 TaxID=2824887 RepID=UPI001B366403|nr:AAA domain-containing protein [Streptomyces sp. F63]MBQ0985565.1 hypothetical protein [Streptomyces sp. F63]
MAFGVERVVDLIKYFCCDAATARCGPYEAVVPDEPIGLRELLPGHLYLTRELFDAEANRQVDVSVYLGLTKLGGLLWDQQVRALTRLSGLEHPCLPVLLGGGYLDAVTAEEAGLRTESGEGTEAAFIATVGADNQLSPADGEMLRGDPAGALRQFELLADALAHVHDLGLTHRRLSPAALDVVIGSDGEYRLRLARFELSSFVAGLLSGASADSSAAGQLRELVLAEGPEPLPYLAPERLAYLLPRPGEPDHVVESAKGDVYGLAAVAWEWFVEPLPQELVPKRVPREAAEAVAERDRLERLGEHLLDRLQHARLPSALRDLLRRMLDPHPRNRPTADEVAGHLNEHHEANVIEFGGAVSSLPHLLAFMPERGEETLGKWNWLEHPADSEAGIRETAELLRTDLRRGEVLWSPDGADPFVNGGSTESKREATVVLAGARALWFCQLLRPRQGLSLGAPMPEVLVVKYVARLDAYGVQNKLEDLRAASLKRPMPEIKALSYRTPAPRLNALRRDRPSWEAFTDAIRPAVAKSTAQLDYERAINWLLEFQGVELRARRYPYETVADAPGDGTLVRWDQQRDQDRVHSHALLTKYAGNPELRPPFGEFFGRLENEESGSADVEVYAGDHDRKGRNVRSVQAQVVRVEGGDRIVLQPKPGQKRIPPRGWIRPADDIGSETVLRRQADARWELFALKSLVSQLRRPFSLPTLPQRWAGAGEGLLKGGRQAVRDILVHQPFFALQGPPGTGKTTVTARAVAAYLEQESTHRILVSAQSNFTLDNLAARILKDIGARNDEGPTDADPDVPIALRVVSQRGNPDERVRPWLRSELVLRRARQMRQGIDEQLAAGVDPDVRPVLERWRGILDPGAREPVLPELADRLQRGANIVFATCATATPRNLGATGGASSFDWVIVEEAAKAWPTELAIPLVRGTRWTLIGDHFQLPAHRRDEVVRFLDSCVNDPSTAIAAAGADRTTYLKAFDMFGSLFPEQETAGDGTGTGADAAGTDTGADAGVEPVTWRNRPTARLSTQFRMREPIAQVVSRGFYPRPPRPGEPPPEDGMPLGGLATHHPETPAPVEAPGWLRGRALVWLDTAGLPNCQEQPYWKNEGEADIVHRLVSALRPAPVPGRDGFSTEPLAVLTPYRRQAEVLHRYGDLSRFVQTVHAFQGREADIVVVSLVRNKRRGSGSAAESFGHLSRRDLINVLFSRARQLLVVVGEYAHYAGFENGGDTFWQTVCQAVDHYGAVLNAADVLSLEAR